MVMIQRLIIRFCQGTAGGKMGRCFAFTDLSREKTRAEGLNV